MPTRKQAKAGIKGGKGVYRSKAYITASDKKGAVTAILRANSKSSSIVVMQTPLIRLR